MPKDSKQVDKTEDPSDVFTQKEWNTVWNFIRANPEFAKTDSTIKQAIKDYEISVFLKLDEEQNIEYLLYDLETFFTLHKRKTHILSQDRFNLLICKMVTMWKNRDLYKAYKLAVNCPNDDLCKNVIEEYENSLPKQISHSQSKIIQVMENKNLSSCDGRRSLFKSSQEKEFFDAVRDTYPQFIVYPNVAISSIIDFDIIKSCLSNEEKKYFFMAIIDCVVFDYQQLYMPKYFFELDSFYHDNGTQLTKDKYKDNILSAAGQKLHRIRRINKSQIRADFTKLIRELLGSSE